ncbi:SAM-dependent methyltransferase [Planctomycetota bacterium]
MGKRQVARRTEPRPPGWWDGFFDTFRPVFGVIPRRRTNQDVRFLLKKLDLKSGDSFLDCPCGIGRIALPLAAKGLRVTGVDVTRSYLDELARKAARRGLAIDTVRADMRRIKFAEEFDGAANLWTSFGYFEKESDNKLVLKKAYRALRPGGRFMLHLINRDWIMKHFQETDWFETGGVKVLSKRSFDYEASMCRETWTFMRDGQEVSHDTAIRMYSFHELVAMFREVGFSDIEGYGSVKEEPITRDRNMMYVIGKR